jgi:Fe-S cluster assembly protein SufD
MATQLTRSKSRDPLLEASLFSRETVTALSTGLNEPDWLKEKRQVAWTVFEETPMPTTADEDWRRTDLKRIKWEKFKLAERASLASAKGLADLPIDVRDAVGEQFEAAGRIVIANGEVIYLELDPALAEQGVIFTDLSTAIREHPDLVQKYLGTEAVPPSNSKFAALNSALWRGGVFLYLPKEVEVKNPFQAALVLEGAGSTVMPRTLLVADRFATATYIEESISLGDHGQGLNVGVVEI